MNTAAVKVEWERGGELRACVLCVHGDTDDCGDPRCVDRCVGSCGRVAHRICRCPAVVGKREFVNAQSARSRGGACGPEALHLSFPGLAPAGEHVAAVYASVPRIEP